MHRVISWRLWIINDKGLWRLKLSDPEYHNITLSGDVGIDEYGLVKDKCGFGIDELGGYGDKNVKIITW